MNALRLALLIAFSAWICTAQAADGARPSASTDPARARSYLEKRALLRTGELVLRELWFTDVVPPGGGLNTWEATLEGGRVDWLARWDVNSGEDRRTFGSIPSPGGAERFADAVGLLERGGWLELEPGAPDERVMFFAAHQFTVTLSLDGELGAFVLVKKLPYGIAYMPEYEPQRTAFTQAGMVFTKSE